MTEITRHVGVLGDFARLKGIPETFCSSLAKLPLLTLRVMGLLGLPDGSLQWSQDLGPSLELTHEARKGTPDPGVGHWPQVRDLLCHPSEAALGGTCGRLFD